MGKGGLFGDCQNKPANSKKNKLIAKNSKIKFDRI